MNKKRKIIFMLFVFLVLFAIFGTFKVHAANKIVFEDNDNPDYVTVLTICDESYEIIIDEETNVGYFAKCIDESIIELGTCEVIVIDNVNKDAYVLCNMLEENNLGTIIITISDNRSIVTSVNGEIEEYIELYAVVNIVD